MSTADRTRPRKSGKKPKKATSAREPRVVDALPRSQSRHESLEAGAAEVSGLGAHMTKRSFVESCPDLSAKEVVLEAQRQGIGLSMAYVYMIRGSRRTMQPRGRSSLATTDQESLEDRFIGIALELGLRRADDLLTSVRVRLKMGSK